MKSLGKTDKKEYIFIPKGENKIRAKRLAEWEKLDSLKKRVLWKYDERYRKEYNYLKISVESGILLISYNRAKVVVYNKSEFIEKKCICFYKLFYENGKVFKKGFEGIVDAIGSYSIDYPKILDILKIDFLKSNNRNEHIDTFSFISNDTILKKLLLGKITNKKELFKVYFQSRYKKVDKFPLKEAERIVRETSNKDLFFRLLRTSINAHITIDNYKAIWEYPHIEDLSLEAQLLKKKINYNRSYKALDTIHSDFSAEILRIKMSSSSLQKENIYRIETIEPTYNLYLLQSESDFYFEGEMQKHCIYSYYNKANNFVKDLYKGERLWNKGYIYLSYRKKDKIIATMEVEIILNDKTSVYDRYRFIQLYGKRNSKLSKELTKEVKTNFRKYFKKIFIPRVPLL